LIKITGEAELSVVWPQLITIEEKGYPIKDVIYYVKVVKDTPVGHTCYKDMGDWYFIGNSYVKKEFRGQGIYEELITVRDDYLDDKPKVTIVIPIEDSERKRLEKLMVQRGYTKVKSFLDLYGIMSFLEYMRYRRYNLWKGGLNVV